MRVVEDIFKKYYPIPDTVHFHSTRGDTFAKPLESFQIAESFISAMNTKRR